MPWAGHGADASGRRACRVRRQAWGFAAAGASPAPIRNSRCRAILAPTGQMNPCSIMASAILTKALTFAPVR